MRAIATSLKKILPIGSLAGLVDSKTFVLVLRKDADQTKILLSQVKALFSKDFRINKQNVVTQVVIGASSFPDDSESIYELIINAQTAIKNASRHSRVQQVFEKSQGQENLLYQLQQVSLLKNIINSGNLDLSYTPVMSFDQQQGLGLHGKIKWPEKVVHLVSDEAIKAILEDMHSMRLNLINMFMYRAMVQLQKWKNKKLNAKIIITVNCKDLLNRNVVNKILNNLDSFHIANGQLIIELIDEQQINKLQFNTLLESLESLCNAGVTFMADMGLVANIWAMSKEGHTTNYIEYISITRDIINKSTTESSYVSLIRGINKLAHETNLQTMALHIDTQQQFDRLMASGCNFMAGNYVGKELDEDAGMLWLNKHSL